MTNRVEHPDYYQGENGIETIEIIRHYTCDIANALKYLMRAGKKQEMGMEDAEKEIEDLKKALWYIEDYKDNLKPTMQKLTQTRTIEKRIIQTTEHSLLEITHEYESTIAKALNCLLMNGLIWNGKELCHELWMNDMDDATKSIQHRILDISYSLADKELKATMDVLHGKAIDGEDYVSKPGCIRKTEPEKYDPLNMIVAWGRVYSLTDEVRKKPNGALYGPCDNCDLQEYCVSQDGTESLKNLCQLHDANDQQYYREVGVAKYSPKFGTVEVVDEMKEIELELRELERAEEDEYSSAERERSRVKGQQKRLEEEH